MAINRSSQTVTPSAGSFTLTIPQRTHATLKHIYVKPATGTTTYDMTIKDHDDFELYEITGQYGLLIEQVEIPTVGDCTVAVANASANEAFRVVMTFLEHS